jgi:aspartate aminotransferase
MNERIAALRRAGRPVYRLGFGQSPFPVPPTVVAALRAHAHEKDYLPVRGLGALREAVARHAQRHDAIDRSADDILIGPGSKQLLFLAQLVLDADLVLPSPSWVSYAPQAQLLGRKVTWLHTRAEDDWQLDPEALDAHCRSSPAARRLLILNYPNNPGGTSLDAGRLEALAAVLRRHGVLAIVDEIYGLTHHSGRQSTLASWYPEGTIVSSGMSKWCGAGGWRLGTFSFPPGLRWLLDAMSVAASETHSAVAAPVQHAAVVAYQGGAEIDRYLGQTQRILGAIGRLSARLLAEAGWNVRQPAGGFYLFPDASPWRQACRRLGAGTSTALCESLLADRGVTTLPGAVFGRPPEELTVRVAYVDFDGAAALAAAEGQAGGDLDDAFARAQAPQTIEGIEQMAAWLHQARRAHAMA